MKKKINLICLPFAGGNKYSYREYAEKAATVLNVVTLEYPGRGARIKEAFANNIQELIEDLYRQIGRMVDHNDYAIYGHSMGGLCAYLLTLKLLEKGHRPPLHVFITGTSGPSSTSRKEKMRSLMSKKEFIDEIIDFGGMPDEILQNEELLYYFEPILRSDFSVSENYEYQPREPLDIHFTVITGTEEDMKKEDIDLWQLESLHPVDIRQLPGNHFFIYNHITSIIEIISGKLLLNAKALTI